MIILVTGAVGFLGRAILRHLACRYPKASLIAADCDATGTALDASVRYRQLDVTDRDACLTLMLAEQPTHLVHGAAVTLADERAKDQVMAVNVLGTANILDAAVVCGSLQRALLLSSSGVYAAGPSAKTCDEAYPLGLSSAYAQSKQAAEALMAAREAAGGFPIAAARIGPVYGPSERARPSRPRVSLIRFLCDRLMSGRPLTVSGMDYRRDWTHEQDIAAALDALLTVPVLDHRLYNVSAGRAISAREVIGFFGRQGLRVRFVPEHGELVLDPSAIPPPLDIARLKGATGFRPRIDFFDSLAAMITAENAPQFQGTALS